MELERETFFYRKSNLNTNSPFSTVESDDKESLTFASFLGYAKRWWKSSPSAPVVTERFGLAAEATQRVLLEAIGIVERKTIVLLPFN